MARAVRVFCRREQGGGLALRLGRERVCCGTREKGRGGWGVGLARHAGAREEKRGQRSERRLPGSNPLSIPFPSVRPQTHPFSLSLSRPRATHKESARFLNPRMAAAGAEKTSLLASFRCVRGAGDSPGRQAKSPAAAREGVRAGRGWVCGRGRRGRGGECVGKRASGPGCSLNPAVSLSFLVRMFITSCFTHAHTSTKKRHIHTCWPHSGRPTRTPTRAAGPACACVARRWQGKLRGKRAILQFYYGGKRLQGVGGIPFVSSGHGAHARRAGTRCAGPGPKLPAGTRRSLSLSSQPAAARLRSRVRGSAHVVVHGRQIVADRGVDGALLRVVQDLGRL